MLRTPSLLSLRTGYLALRDPQTLADDAQFVDYVRRLNIKNTESLQYSLKSCPGGHVYLLSLIHI